MQVYGVPPQGRELELFPGLTLQVPFGAAYARDEEGSLSLFMPWPTPRSYRDGPFELDDEAEMDWKLNSFRQVFSGTLEVPASNAAAAVEEHMEEIARNLTEDKDRSESDEDRYTFDTEEKEDGLTFQANFSTAQAGGSYEKPVTRGHVTLCVVHQRMRVMRFHITVSHLLVGVTDYPHMRYYLAGLGVPDEEKRADILQKRLFPPLFSLKFTAPPSLSDLLGKTPEELFPAAVRQLDFAAGEQVEAGEFTVTIPRGLHYTRTENPQTRFFTAIPQEIPFDAEDYWNYSAVMLTFQTGVTGVCLHSRLDTPEGEREVKQILKSVRSQDTSRAGQTQVGQTTRAAWGPDHYICYELLDDNDVDVNFRYYVLTKSFIYPGQYVGKKTGLGPDSLKTHTGILETYLRGFRYAGGGEKLLEDARRQALGRFAGSDGRMDALKAVQLFNQDVLFFPEGTLTWDGKHHIYREIHLNAEKQEEFPDLRENGQEIIQALRALIDACEDDERLRVPAAKLGKDLRTFLKGADLTGAALFHLAAYHLFWFRELEEAPGSFQILVDTRLKNTIPHSTEYFKTLLEILRAYNGDPAPVVPGPVTVFRAVDIPDIFGDGGPCLAEADGFHEAGENEDEDDAEYQDILGILQSSMDSADLSGLSESDQEDIQNAMHRIAGNLQSLNRAVRGEAPKPPKPAAGSRDLGRFAGADGRLDAFMAVHFFTEDVIFFHPEDLLWDGKRHSFSNYRFNAAVLPNAEGVLEHSDAILAGLEELIAELEENPELRVPAEDLHPEMRRFLKGADFTPAVVFYMECFNFFEIREDAPDTYCFFLQETLGNSFYSDPRKDFDYPYFEKFIGALRAYNGNHEPYTAFCGGITGGLLNPAMPDIKVAQYVQDEYGFIQTDENGENLLRQKTPEELAWEVRMAKKAAEAELAKVPFDRVSSVAVSGSTFVLTGDFEKDPEDRDEVKRLIEARGGRCTGSVSGKTNYLVVGALGNFGQRKIEQVQEQRAKGKTIRIIREADLMAALEGRRSAPPKAAPPKPAPPKAAPPKATPPKPSAPSAQKTGDEADVRAGQIRTVLSSVPMTAPEINAALGTDYTALQIALAVKRIPEARTTKVVRSSANAQGLMADREWTAYCLDGGSAPSKPAAPRSPAPKPSAPKPAPRSAPARKSGEGSVRVEEIEPEDGEFLRLRVTVDIPGLTDDEPAPPPKPKKRAQVDEQEKKKLRALREEAEKRAEAACSEAVKKGEGTRWQMNSRIEKLQKDIGQQEQRLQSLGLFKLGEKNRTRQEIARLNQELSQARQELNGFLQKLEQELGAIRERCLKDVVEKVRRAAYGYLFDCDLPQEEQTAVFSILQSMSGTPRSRSELMDAFYYSNGLDTPRSLVSKAFMNPFVQNGSLKRIRADGTTETLTGYYL